MTFILFVLVFWINIKGKILRALKSKVRYMDSSIKYKNRNVNTKGKIKISKKTDMKIT